MAESIPDCHEQRDGSCPGARRSVCHYRSHTQQCGDTQTDAPPLVPFAANAKARDIAARDYLFVLAHSEPQAGIVAAYDSAFPRFTGMARHGNSLFRERLG